MKKLVLFIFFTCISLQGEVLELNDCITQAKIYSKKIKSSKNKILISEAIKQQALSPLLPHIDLEGRYEIKNKGQDYSVFTEYGSSFSTKTIGINANLLLFDFYSSWNEYQASKCEVNISKYNFDKSLLELIEDVKIAYFKVLENENTTEIINNSIKNLNEELKSIKNSFLLGSSSKEDLSIIQMQLVDQKKRLLHANTLTLQSKINLNNLLGRDDFSKLELKNLPIDNYPKKTLSEMQNTALSNHSEIKAQHQKIKSLNHLLKGAKSSHAPNFFAFGGYHYLDDAPNSNCKKTTSNWISGGIGMRLSLYAGGKNQAEIQKNKTRISQAQLELDDLKKNILFNVTTYYLKEKEILENILLDDEIIKLSEDNFISISKKYFNGLEKINSLIKAENSLIEAKLNKNKNIYLYHIIKANIDSILGI